MVDPPGHLDLSGAPFTLQVSMADHTDGLSAAVDGLCDVLYDGFTWKHAEHSHLSQNNDV